ncbi:Uncharacterized protein FWK35_00008622 [Aphis craccivora]|uniref:Uncharacterized protein n=1 Tax=Aphis craccivora TaxID=307492 RepID=A0A6G0ZHI6_APHCR|nr:Uncharacterized protein FWK35_00008622 [Aphis craccivora]
MSSTALPSCSMVRSFSSMAALRRSTSRVNSLTMAEVAVMAVIFRSGTPLRADSTVVFRLPA